MAESIRRMEERQTAIFELLQQKAIRTASVESVNANGSTVHGGKTESATFLQLARAYVGNAYSSFQMGSRSQGGRQCLPEGVRRAIRGHMDTMYGV